MRRSPRAGASPAPSAAEAQRRAALSGPSSGAARHHWNERADGAIRRGHGPPRTTPLALRDEEDEPRARRPRRSGRARGRGGAARAVLERPAALRARAGVEPRGQGAPEDGGERPGSGGRRVARPRLCRVGHVHRRADRSRVRPGQRGPRDPQRGLGELPQVSPGELPGAPCRDQLSPRGQAGLPRARRGARGVRGRRHRQHADGRLRARRGRRGPRPPRTRPPQRGALAGYRDPEGDWLAALPKVRKPRSALVTDVR